MSPQVKRKHILKIEESDRKRGSREAELKDKEEYRGTKHKFNVAIKESHPQSSPTCSTLHIPARCFSTNRKQRVGFRHKRSPHFCQNHSHTVPVPKSNRESGVKANIITLVEPGVKNPATEKRAEENCKAEGVEAR